MSINYELINIFTCITIAINSPSFVPCPDIGFRFGTKHYVYGTSVGVLFCGGVVKALLFVIWCNSY